MTKKEAMKLIDDKKVRVVWDDETVLLNNK